ncbi:DUF6895 family protein [Bacillus taeanensis]|uniref:DUF6895 domain-containing protein n=1 Tax=Bacillus taeanensis TaxID=273032 RepID=A0A366XRG2_9BACI|nr:hypothetical protein [Bacillus taeanensis]RBW68286.1 hypothetical protein DS031_17335 [Bacillus taeanensis]
MIEHPIILGISILIKEVSYLDIEKFPPQLKLKYSFLHQLASRSIDWVNRYLYLFSPIKDNKLDYDGLQAFSELSVVYTYLHQWKNLNLTNHLPAWYHFISHHCENRSYAQTARKYPIISFSILFPYLMLRASGYRLLYYEETLEYLSRFGYLYTMEADSELIMEQAFVYWKANYCQEPNWLKLYRRTLLGNKSSPISLTEDDAYSVTHTLFYITDFGNQSFSWLLDDRERISAVVEYLLLHYLQVGNWDLVGELLINLNSLGKCSSPIYREAARAFQNAWRNDGAIPYGRMIKTKLDMLQGKIGAEEIFRICYHTTLIGILYCATAMNQMLIM